LQVWFLFVLPFGCCRKVGARQLRQPPEEDATIFNFFGMLCSSKGLIYRLIIKLTDQEAFILIADWSDSSSALLLLLIGH